MHHNDGLECFITHKSQSRHTYTHKHTHTPKILLDFEEILAEGIR